LFIKNHIEIYEKLNFKPLNFFEYFIITYISLIQLTCLFSVSVIIIKQLYYIFLGSPFYEIYKKKEIEIYFPCMKTNNDEKEVSIF